MTVEFDDETIAFMKKLATQIRDKLLATFKSAVDTLVVDAARDMSPHTLHTFELGARQALDVISMAYSREVGLDPDATAVAIERLPMSDRKVKLERALRAMKALEDAMGDL